MLFTTMGGTREEVSLRVYNIKISVSSLLNIHVEILNRYLDV